jgi:hypothetical protein
MDVRWRNWCLILAQRPDTDKTMFGWQMEDLMPDRCLFGTSIGEKVMRQGPKNDFEIFRCVTSYLFLAITLFIERPIIVRCCVAAVPMVTKESNINKPNTILVDRILICVTVSNLRALCATV